MREYSRRKGAQGGNGIPINLCQLLPETRLLTLDDVQAKKRRSSKYGE